MTERPRGRRRAAKVRAPAKLLARILLAAALSGGAARAITFASNHAATAYMGMQTGSEAFEGVGQISCPGPGRRGIMNVATAWVIGSADTVITAAHAFVPSDGAAVERQLVLDPSGCTFALFNPDQSVRDVARIRYAISPWARHGLRYDSSYDVAVAKLDHKIRLNRIATARVAPAAQRRAIRLISFQRTEAGGDMRAMAASGDATPFPREQIRYGGMPRITRASRMFSSSASSTAGSSGGMYLAEKGEAAIGIHIGNICETETLPARFDAGICFNFGLFFNSAIFAMVDAVVRDAPLSKDLLSDNEVQPAHAGAQ